MNGFTLVASFLSLTCGAGPSSEDLTQKCPPGTNGTVLMIPDGVTLDICQVPKRDRQVIQIDTGREFVRAPVIRFEYQGRLFDVFATPTGPSVTQYPKGTRNPPRPTVPR